MSLFSKSHITQTAVILLTPFEVSNYINSQDCNNINKYIKKCKLGKKTKF